LNNLALRLFWFRRIFIHDMLWFFS
jgi:hypothetical protein